MVKKGKFRGSYVDGDEKKNIIVDVVLKQHKTWKPKQNCWYGIATINGKDYEHESLLNTINAQISADVIGNEILNKMNNVYNSKNIKKKK